MSTKTPQTRVDELENLVVGLEASAARSAAMLREKIENLEANSAQAIAALVDRIEKLEANTVVVEKIQEYPPINAAAAYAADCRRLRMRQDLKYYHDE